MTTIPENESTHVATAGAKPIGTRGKVADRVAALIAQKARAAGISDIAYFHEILKGKAPRIKRSEAGID